MTQNTTHNAPGTAGQSRPQTYNLHPVIQRLFEKREFSEQDIHDFMSWNLRELPELTELKDLSKTAKRIIEAMDKGEKIGIYGDYDVDGTTSCALFYHFFQMHNVEVALIQPSRFVEGYGLHISSIDKSICLMMVSPKSMLRRKPST